MDDSLGLLLAGSLVSYLSLPHLQPGQFHCLYLPADPPRVEMPPSIPHPHPRTHHSDFNSFYPPPLYNPEQPTWLQSPTNMCTHAPPPTPPPPRPMAPPSPFSNLASFYLHQPHGELYKFWPPHPSPISPVRQPEQLQFLPVRLPSLRWTVSTRVHVQYHKVNKILPHILTHVHNTDYIL